MHTARVLFMLFITLDDGGAGRGFCVGQGSPAKEAPCWRRSPPLASCAPEPRRPRTQVHNNHAKQLWLRAPPDALSEDRLSICLLGYLRAQAAPTPPQTAA